jgi:hypothetical protein
MKYELDFNIREDAILRSHLRENLKSYRLMQSPFRLSLYIPPTLNFSILASDYGPGGGAVA